MAKSMQGWARRKVMCKRKTKKKTDESSTLFVNQCECLQTNCMRVFAN
jgi:hypothetical protein